MSVAKPDREPTNGLALTRRIWHHQSGMAEPQVKGMAMINARNWLDARLGPGWFTSAARKVEPDWPERLLPGDWYAARTSDQIYHQAFELIEGFESRQQLMETVTVEVALVDLNGILRAFLWAASPKLFLRTTPKIWATYSTFVALEILRNDPGSYAAKLTEIPEDLVTWVTAAWRGFLPPALGLTGATDVVVTTSQTQVTPGADTWEMVYELSYA